MPTYKIRGINVDFPYEAYDCQIEYMDKVIQSLQQRRNALLESPTGTGKTLCLLCATLAWRKSLGPFSSGRIIRKSTDAGDKLSDEPLSQSDSAKLPTIIYTSRTHSQIRQVIQELKRTNYRPKMTVLGSREQLCIHEEVSLLRGKLQTNACQSLCQKRKKRYCGHYSRVAEFMKSNPNLGDEPIDIEDLVNIGKSSGPCPYFVSRDLHKVVDILFAPYNYLIDHGNRKSLGITWESSVLIFDEAHNLEAVCADAASFDLTSGLLTACIAEAKNCVDLSIARRDMSNDKSCNPDDFAILRALLLKLERRIAEIPIQSKDLGFTKPGPYVYELLADLNITHKTATMLINIIEEAALLLEEDAKSADKGGSQKTKGTVCRLESISEMLNLIFKDGGNAHAAYYRVHVQEVDASGSDVFKGSVSRTFSWWCFNPGVAMEEFSKLGVGSIILTSGTLSPMDSFADELKLEFPIRLENPHVISGDQIWAGIVPVGPSGYPFNSSYKSRDSSEYKLELGNAIVNFARIVPDGLLVFFPSYYLLDLFVSFWKNMSHSTSANSSSIWERICKHKLPVVEPRQSSLFPTAIDDFMTKLRDKSSSGAVFFAVCRGKVSEGLDFADNAGRAVIITGVPFALWNDPKVRLKREFLDQQAVSQLMRSQSLTGEEWYSQQASRAVNQAVGRVIRHRHDYGAIIFCDERFTNSNRQSQISRWIQPHIKCYSKFGDVVFTLTRFFRDAPRQEFIHSKTPGDISSQNNVGSLKKPQLDKLLSPVSESMCKTSSFESLPPLVKVKKEDTFNKMGQILPANRSKLPYSSAFKLSSNSVYEEKLLFGEKTSVQSNKREVVDLTKNDSLDDETFKDLLAPCSQKKPKLEIPQCSYLTRNCETSCKDVVKKEPSVNPPIKDEMVTHRRTIEQCKKSEGVVSSSATCGDEEKKGSTFLIQVREKLTDKEYKEFVGFMKALKSKAMKIGHVLQSIARLFSAPDRLPLLRRFKDYVPEKYHSLYEQYLEPNNSALDMK